MDKKPKGIKVIGKIFYFDNENKENPCIKCDFRSGILFCINRKLCKAKEGKIIKIGKLQLQKKGR